MEWFWPGKQRLARQSVSSAISHIRKELSRAGGGQGSDYLIRDASGVRLNPDRIAYSDVSEFESLLKTEGNLSELRRLSSLIRGPYLEGCYMDWVTPERRRYERESLEALLRLGQLCHAEELYEEGLEHLLKAHNLDRFHESVVRWCLEIYLKLGRPSQAQRFFESFSKRLKRELDLEPTIELLKLYQRVRLGL